MTLQDAIRKRVIDLCEERSISFKLLQACCGISTSTLEGIMQKRNTRMETIEKICDGLGITIADFFCCDTFRNLDPISKT